MSLKNFQTKVKKHLGVYKKTVLKIPQAGIFNYQQRKILYEHILPEDKEQLNIMDKYRTDFFGSPYANKVILHKYFRHLNSSQAMCINFFYPLIKEGLLEEILELIGVEGEISYNPEDVCFEKESEVEKSSDRKTNFDFYLKLKSGIKIYFEVKYTEREFGVAVHDVQHLSKYYNTYLPLLKDNPSIKEGFKTEEFFLNNYQVMRNISHIDKESYVIFIYPEENKGISKAALSAKKDIMETEWNRHLILFTWEGLIEQLKRNLNSKELIDYYDKDFSYKYLEY